MNDVAFKLAILSVILAINDAPSDAIRHVKEAAELLGECHNFVKKSKEKGNDENAN